MYLKTQQHIKLKWPKLVKFSSHLGLSIDFMPTSEHLKSYQLSTFLPTSHAVNLHLFRVFLQIENWHGNHFVPVEWRRGTGLKPIPSLTLPTPDDLLHLVSCNCRKGRRHQCEGRRASLSCSFMRSQCRTMWKFTNIGGGCWKTKRLWEINFEASVCVVNM